jgi:DNA-binding HxlR family transcriptional regulator
MQPARGDARGCLVIALPRIPETRAGPSIAGFLLPRTAERSATAGFARLAYDVVIEGGIMSESDPAQAPRGNLFSETCPSRDVLKHVTSRWGVLLLVALGDGAQRFGELRRKVGGISEKMLAQTLVWLEQDGFVQRIAHPVAPPRVEYRLTPLGEEISVKLRELAAWIEVNLAGILAAQGRAPGLSRRS